MERQYITENNQSRERLQKLVDEITDKELKLVIYQEGWTVAVMLAHMAFWDQYDLALLKKWQKDGVLPSPHEWDAINDALLPLALALSPKKAAELAVSSAGAVDRYIEKVAPDFVKAVEKLADPYRLNRSLHRNAHLDEIDAFLKTRRSKA